MRLANIRIDNTEHPAIVHKNGFIRLKDINRTCKAKWPQNMDRLLQQGQIPKLNEWYSLTGKNELDRSKDTLLAPQQCAYAPLYRNPPKIWGIGLNYREHAEDLSEKAPTAAPASFMKPRTAIIGPGDSIQIPVLSRKTTAEAELGVIIGRQCRNVPVEKWLDVVAGFTTILDMTAEDILRQNPRYLTLSKSFDTFFSFGPQLLTPDEIDDIASLKVTTTINGRTHAENTINHMTFTPDQLIAYHSQVMTLQPGDIISTGTPGAVHIRHGDTVQCRITGFEPLENSVVDLKRTACD